MNQTGQLHYPGVTCGQVVQTSQYKTTRALLEKVIENRQAAIVSGAPGVGKTLLLRSTVASVGGQLTVVTDMPVSGSPKEFLAQTWLHLTGRRPNPRTPAWDLCNEVVELLRGQPVVLAVDEAQNLRADALDQAVTLWDHPDTQVALVLVGHDAARHVRTHSPRLWSRALFRQTIGRIPARSLIATLTEYHPVFAATDPALLADLDTTLCHGNWREWAKVAATAEALALTRLTNRDITMLIRSLGDPDRRAGVA